MDYNIREVQLAELAILKDFAVYCDAHNLKYFLSEGTLLGAVRHKGFIPWDDDVDVMMPINDYLRFLEISKTDYDSKYFIQTYRTDFNWYRPHAKIRLNDTTMIEKGFVNYHVHQGIWIDIFIVVPIKSSFDLSLKRKIITCSNYLQAQDYIKNSIPSEFEEKFGKIGFKLLGLLYKLPDRMLLSLHDRLLRIVFSTKSRKYTSLLWSNLAEMMPPSIFEGEPEKLKFENEYFNCPAQYKEYLKIQYGDYMQLPPESERYTHSASIVDFNKSYLLYQEENSLGSGK